MALPPLVRQLVEAKLGSFCASRIPEHARHQVRLGFGIRGNSVTLYEERVTFFKPGEWVRIRVAQLRYAPEDRSWTLYWRDRNDRWHEYSDLDPTSDLTAVLAEIDADPTCIFWG
jgi:hypothetical protein